MLTLVIFKCLFVTSQPRREFGFERLFGFQTAGRQSLQPLADAHEIARVLDQPRPWSFNQKRRMDESRQLLLHVVQQMIPARTMRLVQRSARVMVLLKKLRHELHEFLRDESQSFATTLQRLLEGSFRSRERLIRQVCTIGHQQRQMVHQFEALDRRRKQFHLSDLRHVADLDEDAFSFGDQNQFLQPLAKNPRGLFRSLTQHQANRVTVIAQRGKRPQRHARTCDFDVVRNIEPIPRSESCTHPFGFFRRRSAHRCSFFRRGESRL